MTSDAMPAPALGPSETAAPQKAQLPRVWPAVVLVGAYWTYYVASNQIDMPMFGRFLSQMAVLALVTLCFLVWWLIRRRVSWTDRLAGLGVAVVGGAAAVFLSDQTLGGMAIILGLPWLLTIWAGWLLVSRKMSARARRTGLVTALALTWGFFLVTRFDGLRGTGTYEIRWRWAPYAEDLYLAGRAGRSAEAASPRDALSLQPGDWPGFRGPNRDGVVRGVSIATDWDAAPPKQMWRQRVGPAWSSMAIIGDFLFTQEQRGKTEAVVCLDAATAKEVWAHEDAARFQERLGGIGPRATPTFADGRIYALGGTGILNCLDAVTGERKWWHDIAADSGAKVLMWGFASSPLVVDGMVIVFAGGAGPKNLLAYRADSGELEWTAAAGKDSYSSPQLASFDGVNQVLFLSDRELTAVDPASGSVLWKYDDAKQNPRSLQPLPVGKSQVLIALGMDLETALLDVTQSGDAWTPAVRWSSRHIKPSFNDFVVHDGFLYGFDGSIFCCVDVRTGARRWKGGRYDNGQVLLLADQSLLLVVSESGEAVLVAAKPDRHEELGRFQAITGKTWNHSVVAHGRLYVRNAEEMACYQLGPAQAR